VTLFVASCQTGGANPKTGGGINVQENERSNSKNVKSHVFGFWKKRKKRTYSFRGQKSLSL